MNGHQICFNQIRLAFLLLIFASLVKSLAQAPSIDYAISSAMTPKGTATLRFYGDHLESVTELWTSFAAESSRKVEVSTGSVAFDLQMPGKATPGIGLARLIGTNGVSSLQFVLLSPLSSTNEAGSNKKIITAQPLKIPIAVDGRAESQASDFFQFTAERGQVISAEVIAQRLGFAMDPVLRLLDAQGRELAYCEDSPGIGADARLSYRCLESGNYYLEIRDTHYQGGGKYRYRLRVTGGQLPSLPLLTANLVGELWDQRKDTSPSLWEMEPNNMRTNAVPIPVPALVHGRFEQDGDRDFYQFHVAKGERLIFRGDSRALGSPCDLFMQIYQTNGTLIAEANADGADEGAITNTFSSEGDFQLMVEELNRKGGPDFAYQVAIQPYEPGFSLTVDTDKLNVSSGGTFELKVSCLRRDYSGPIGLSLIGLGDEYQLDNNFIAAKATEARLTVTLRKTWHAGQMTHFAVIGRANIGDSFFEARASTLPAWRKLYPSILYPPKELDGVIGLGVTQ